MPDLRSFTYEALTENQQDITTVRSEGISAVSYPHALRQVDPWIRFNANLPAKASGAKTSSGWKVHLSIDPADIAKAWNAILPLLAEHSIHAKVIGPSLGKILNDPNHKQAGKSIALAGGGPLANDPVFWRNLLVDIEAELARVGARPCWAVRGDMPVVGGSYSYVRFDEDPSGHYSSSIDAFNPFSVECHFDHIVLPKAFAPRAQYSKADQAMRLLNMIEPGWQNTNGTAVIAMSSPAAAGDVYRAMRAYGIAVQINESMLFVANLTSQEIVEGWHDAMEVRRAAQIGRILVDALPEGAAKMSIRRRSRGAAPPEIQITFDDPDAAERLFSALSSLRALGNAKPRLDGGRVILPYAGRFHTIGGIDAHWQHTLSQAAEMALDIAPSMAM